MGSVWCRWNSGDRIWPDDRCSVESVFLQSGGLPTQSRAASRDQTGLASGGEFRASAHPGSVILATPRVLVGAAASQSHASSVGAGQMRSQRGFADPFGVGLAHGFAALDGSDRIALAATGAAGAAGVVGQDRFPPDAGRPLGGDLAPGSARLERLQAAIGGGPGAGPAGFGDGCDPKAQGVDGIDDSPGLRIGEKPLQQLRRRRDQPQAERLVQGFGKFPFLESRRRDHGMPFQEAGQAVHGGGFAGEPQGGGIADRLLRVGAPASGDRHGIPGPIDQIGCAQLDPIRLAMLSSRPPSQSRFCRNPSWLARNRSGFCM